MASFSQARSNSLPSRSDPPATTVEDHLCRLKFTDTTSLSTSSICRNLASLGDLHESLHDLIQLPSVQRELCIESSNKWADETLDGLVRLLDVCSTDKDIMLHMKEFVKELESALRRNRGEESSIAHDIVDAYATSKKKINKMITRCIRNLKVSKKKSSMALVNKEGKALSTKTIVEETEVISFSILKSVLLYLPRIADKSKQRGWSLVNKFTQSKQVHCDIEEEQEGSIHDALSALIEYKLSALIKYKSYKESKVAAIQNVTEQLRLIEMTIQELEELLETIFKSLIKRRALLLNIFDH